MTFALPSSYVFEKYVTFADTLLPASMSVSLLYPSKLIGLVGAPARSTDDTYTFESTYLSVPLILNTYSPISFTYMVLAVPILYVDPFGSDTVAVSS